MGRVKTGGPVARTIWAGMTKRETDMSIRVLVEDGSPWSVEILSMAFVDLVPRIELMLYFGSKSVSALRSLGTESITSGWDNAGAALVKDVFVELRKREVVTSPDLTGRLTEALLRARTHCILAVIRNQAATLVGFVPLGDALQIWADEGARFVMEA